MMNSSKEEEGWLREGVIWSDCSYNLTSSQDMEDPSSSQQFMDGSRFWIQRVMVPFIVGVGVLGNVVTVVVLTRSRMRSSTNVYLTALAVSDLLYLLLVFTLSLEYYPNFHDVTHHVYWQLRPFAQWMTDSASNTSIWLTVSFTVERYIAVCHPMRGKMLCTESRARKVILAVYLVCFLSTVTTSFEWTICQRYNGTSVIHYYLDSTKLAVNETYRTAFYWFTSVTFIFLPLTALGVFNSILIYYRPQEPATEVPDDAGWFDIFLTPTEQRDNSTQSQENKITVTLIAVVVLFMFCQIPTALILLYTSFQEPLRGSTKDNVLRGLGNIFNFLNAVNAACNFILYCAFSDKYRRTFLTTFFGSCYRVPGRLHSQTSYSTEMTTAGIGSSFRHLSLRSNSSKKGPSSVRYGRRDDSLSAQTSGNNHASDNGRGPTSAGSFKSRLQNWRLPSLDRHDRSNGASVNVSTSQYSDESCA
uniref:G-protein coupled receptors family 1 profile domain-containing protein n=1 Tax=Timema genevievae TaxID=629358 RepID=A0A7R9PHN2_TIMGE|nr:unnamed protein product [Timema genevievae]